MLNIEVILLVFSVVVVIVFTITILFDDDESLRNTAKIMLISSICFIIFILYDEIGMEPIINWLFSEYKE